MEKERINEATCETCGRIFSASVKRYYCSHCNKYYHVCSSCAEADAKCRFCGIPLKRKTEPQLSHTTRKRQLQRV
jgi:hypothetical protein